MEKHMRILIAVVMSLLLVACGTTEYVVSTKDGTLITAYGKPVLDEETGMYKYYDQDGKELYLTKDEVAQIMER
ncbi:MULTISPECIES: YgdI/YgdR family lipoprotein [Corallincola]|uniref:YgdI/YgdR family lipoprotein n=3 Tax=Corallincola TaxID=1775176 RepID=A0A368N478_9GAMM|nr:MULTISPECIES: YgdI/YgdR family lipoprotein [Corallincola]RCU45308.1 YgdI/YgdR family lipoprotein [Corallincola holothuriorum]TAA42585.1 YgdI/YgdR family lipoprotein [Corallincola spongiicola]TCI01288.1 YgdI/YgdR family lipoprotein [Corallincola luteus]